MLDLRLPTGSFFALVGLLLIGMAIVSPDSRAALSDANVNLYCGLSMIVFGAFMLLMAWRGSRRQP